MKLLMSPASPFVRKARVVIRESGLMDQVAEVEVTTSPMASAAEVVAANPLGKIPALLRDGETTLFDSRVITRYLDSKGSTNLYPEAAIWDVLALEATADGIMDATVGMTYEMRFREGALRYDDWLDGQWEKARRAILSINDGWMDHLNGPLTIGHIGVGCALGYIDLRHDDRGWRSDAPALANWFKGFADRSSMKTTKPD